MSDDERFGSEPKRSSRDHGDLHRRMTDWLRHRTGDPRAQVGELSTPSGSGMSSETVLFDATWNGDRRELVARLAPAAEDVPVFRSYDLDLQFRVLRLVADRTDVPVPTPLWLEPESEPIGSPFFVMERRHGRVPADIPPYVFDGWLLHAAPEDQRRLQDASVGVIAGLNAIRPGVDDTAFLETDAPGDSPLRRLFNDQRLFYEWVCPDREHPLIEQTFAWLEERWPDESPTAVSWGDARIGNIMYEHDGFTPVAVFDWEMATLAPAEVDLGWMVFLHSFFQNIAEVMELPGMPDFMRAPEVRATYAEITGNPVGELRWFEVFAALRHAIIMSRITDRQVRFGEKDGWPDDVDEAIPHRDLLYRMMEDR